MCFWILLLGQPTRTRDILEVKSHSDRANQLSPTPRHLREDLVRNSICKDGYRMQNTTCFSTAARKEATRFFLMWWDVFHPPLEGPILSSSSTRISLVNIQSVCLSHSKLPEKQMAEGERWYSFVKCCLWALLPVILPLQLPPDSAARGILWTWPSLSFA